jgi:hypothetical protein
MCCFVEGLLSVLSAYSRGVFFVWICVGVVAELIMLTTPTTGLVS